MSSIRRLQLRRPKSGGQYEGVVSIGSTWYVEIFGSLDEARAFADKWNLELVEPRQEADDGVPEVPPQDRSRRQ